MQQEPHAHVHSHTCQPSRLSGPPLGAPRTHARTQSFISRPRCGLQPAALVHPQSAHVGQAGGGSDAACQSVLMRVLWWV